MTLMNPTALLHIDEDQGYEVIAQELERIGLTAEDVHTRNLEVVCNSVWSAKFQKCFDIPASKVCQNGQPLIDFALYDGVFQGVLATLSQYESALKRKCGIVGMSYKNNVLTLSVGPA